MSDYTSLADLAAALSSGTRVICRKAGKKEGGYIAFLDEAGKKSYLLKLSSCLTVRHYFRFESTAIAVLESIRRLLINLTSVQSKRFTVPLDLSRNLGHKEVQSTLLWLAKSMCPYRVSGLTELESYFSGIPKNILASQIWDNLLASNSTAFPLSAAWDLSNLEIPAPLFVVEYRTTTSRHASVSLDSRLAGTLSIIKQVDIADSHWIDLFTLYVTLISVEDF